MIEKGQVYVSAATNPRWDEGPIRLKVVSSIRPGPFGYGKVNVVTITDDGREIRKRAIGVAQLHQGPLTRTGKPRKTGYVLESETR